MYLHACVYIICVFARVFVCICIHECAYAYRCVRLYVCPAVCVCVCCVHVYIWPCVVHTHVCGEKGNAPAPTAGAEGRGPGGDFLRTWPFFPRLSGRCGVSAPRPEASEGAAVSGGESVCCVLPGETWSLTCLPHPPRECVPGNSRLGGGRLVSILPLTSVSALTLVSEGPYLREPQLPRLPRRIAASRWGGQQ